MLNLFLYTAGFLCLGVIPLEHFILPDLNKDLVQCMHCITSTMLDVFWIDATWPAGALPALHPVHGFVCFHDCG